MKTYIATLLLTCSFLAGTSSTQAQIKSPLSYGIKAGVSLSATSRNNYDTKLGFMGGVVVDYSLSKNLFIRSGLDFVMKGANLTSEYESAANNSSFPNSRVRYEERIRMNYIQLPITFGYKTDVGNGFNAYINAGPYFAVGVHGRGKFTTWERPLAGSSAESYYNQEKADSFDDLGMKTFDFGVTGSIGVEYSQYFINVGYDYGLTNSAKKVNGEKWNWHNMTGSCTLGYKF